MLAHHLYKWDIRYDNPADQVDNTLLFNDNTQDTKKKTYFADKLFRHFVFALDLQLGKRLEISMGYNHLRRSELALTEKKGYQDFLLVADYTSINLSFILPNLIIIYLGLIVR